MNASSRKSIGLGCIATSVIAVSVMAIYGCGGGSGGSNPAPAPTPTKSFKYGAILPSKQSVDSRVPGISAYGATQGAQLPASVDLTTKSYFPSPGNQQDLGSCVAWSIGYDMMTYMLGKANSWDVSSADHQGSPGDLYAKALQAQNSTCPNGLDPDKTMQTLVQYGEASMSQSPYVDACPQTTSNTGTFGIGGYHVIKPSDTTTLKSELASENIVPFAGAVYDDFQQWGVGPNRTGVYKGSGNVVPNEGHAMALVGYDDSRHAWRVMNSWGTAWGDRGFFWMDYDTFANLASIALVADGPPITNVPSPSPSNTPSFQHLDAFQYLDYFNNTAYLVVDFTLTQPIFVTHATLIYQDGRVAIDSDVNQWAYSSYVWAALPRPEYFPYGTYTLTFQGFTASGQQVSMTQNTVLSGRGASLHSLPGIRGRAMVPPMPADMKPAALRPGMQLIMNGHKVTVRAR